VLRSLSRMVDEWRHYANDQRWIVGDHAAGRTAPGSRALSLARNVIVRVSYYPWDQAVGVACPGGGAHLLRRTVTCGRQPSPAPGCRKARSRTYHPDLKAALLAAGSRLTRSTSRVGRLLGRPPPHVHWALVRPPPGGRTSAPNASKIRSARPGRSTKRRRMGAPGCTCAVAR
jgi:hypothetical protein